MKSTEQLQPRLDTEWCIPCTVLYHLFSIISRMKSYNIHFLEWQWAMSSSQVARHHQHKSAVQHTRVIATKDNSTPHIMSLVKCVFRSIYIQYMPLDWLLYDEESQNNATEQVIELEKDEQQEQWPRRYYGYTRTLDELININGTPTHVYACIL